MDRRALRNKAMKQTKKRITQELASRDNVIVQAVKSIDELDKAANLLLEHVRDWYAIYFPELARSVREADDYLTLMLALKKRERFTKDAIKKAVGEKDYAERLSEQAKRSMGYNLSDDDLNEIFGMAEHVVTLRRERDHINTYLEKVMTEEAPNVSAVIGTTIGARLISIAGSLNRLASFPSSTVQVLGAEKALFAHLRKGTPSPKYGVIFSYPQLHNAPLKKRGKIARHVAAKIAIAAKVDYFHGKYVGDKLAADLEKHISEIVSR